MASDMLNIEGLKLLSLETTPEEEDDDDVAAVLAAELGNDGGRGRTKGLGCVWMLGTTEATVAEDDEDVESLRVDDDDGDTAWLLADDDDDVEYSLGIEAAFNNVGLGCTGGGGPMERYMWALLDDDDDDDVGGPSADCVDNEEE